MDFPGLLAIMCQQQKDEWVLAMENEPRLKVSEH